MLEKIKLSLSECKNWPWKEKINDLKEVCLLVLVNIKTNVIRFKDYLKEVFMFYRVRRFCEADLTLITLSFLDNPFRISKRYLEKKKRLSEGSHDLNVDIYGETPLAALDAAAKAAKANSKDVVIELGAGRGRAALWFNAYLGCKTIAVEQIPEFASLLKRVKNSCHLDQLDVIQGDFLKADLSSGDLIYIFGTALKDEEIKTLIDRLKTVKQGTRIITVSYPLTDYTNGPLFEVMHVIPADFPWGKTSMYVQYKK